MSYICKGNIPKNCSKCPQRTLYHCINVCLAADKMKVSTSNKSRHENCPLVEIPTPHGRLIDADRLLVLIESECNDNCKGCEDGCCAEDRFDIILSAVKNAPTIIEAEVSE